MKILVLTHEFPSGNLEALTEALASLLTSPAAMAAAQRKSRQIAQAFDLGVIVDQYEALFQEAVHNP